MTFFDNLSYDNAIIGISTDDRIIYSYDKLLDVLQNEYDFTFEDAISHIDFNIIRSLDYNENSPIIMYDDDEDLLYEIEQRRTK